MGVRCHRAGLHYLMANVTWNPADTGGNVTFSNGNLTLTSTLSGEVWMSTRATGHASAGKLYFESLLTSQGSGTGGNGDWGIGLLPIGSGLNNFAGSGALGGVGYLPFAGLVIVNGSVAATIQDGTVGNTVQFAVDLGANLMWANVNNGNWNNSGAADPATGVGGISVAGMGTAPFAPTFSYEDSSAATTTNFGASAFAYTVPSGFSTWQASGAGTSGMFLGM